MKKELRRGCAGKGQKTDYDVLEYGALGDGASNDAPAIQRAIDAAAAAGGGRVVVPGGHVYISGTIFLRGGVELHLASGARLKMSADPAAFCGRKDDTPDRNTTLYVPAYENCEYDGEPAKCFIAAQNTEDVRITGFGVIDGSEENFYAAQTEDYIEGTYYPRIPLLLFHAVRHLTITGVTLTKSAFWTVHMVGCSDVLIDGVRILNNTKMVNCDGIDPDHCRNVRIANCHIESADDCIVFKNTHKHLEFGPCENIVVTNCTLTSTSAAIKFGTESEADFRNISVTNCVITNANRGISLQLRDGGHIENVLFANINIRTHNFSDYWWGRAEPISITAVPRHEGAELGCVRNVHFENINCDGENGIFLYAAEPDLVSDISFRRVRIRLDKTTKWPAGSWDLRPCDGDGILPTDVSGFTCVRASDVRCEDVRVECCDSMRPWFGREFRFEEAPQA